MWGQCLSGAAHNFSGAASTSPPVFGNPPLSCHLIRWPWGPSSLPPTSWDPSRSSRRTKREWRGATGRPGWCRARQRRTGRQTPPRGTFLWAWNEAGLLSSVSDKVPASLRRERPGRPPGPASPRTASQPRCCPFASSGELAPGCPDPRRGRPSRSHTVTASPLRVVRQRLLGPLRLLLLLLLVTRHSAQHRATGEGQQQAACQHESRSPGAHRPAVPCWERRPGKDGVGAARLRDGQKLGVHQMLDARAASASAPAGRAAHTRAHTHTQIRALSHTHTLIPVHCTHSCNQHTHCTHKSQRTLACIAHSHTHALLHTHTHMHTHLHTMLKHTPICIQLIHTFGTLDTHISTLTCTLTHTPIHTHIIHMHARILTLRHAARFNIHAFHTLIKLHSHSHTLSRAHATCPCSPGPLGGVGAPRLVLLGTTRPESTKPPLEGPLSRWALQMAIHWPH